MSTLKYAILGLLSKKSMTGYELTKEFNTSVCEFWNARHSQIYPELHQLTEENLVKYEVEITGTCLEKKLYSLTEEGHEALMKWLKKPLRMAHTPKDEFRLQLFFSHNLSPEERVHMLEFQLIQHQARLQFLQNYQEKYDSIPPANTDQFSEYMVLLYGIMREETSCEWLKKCICMCRAE